MWDYIGQVCAEAGQRAEEIRATSAVNTLYIGGGTPSVLPLDAIKKIVEALTAGAEVLMGPSGNADIEGPSGNAVTPKEPFEEFTIEVNPDDVLQGGVAYIEGLKALGVNRISMGVQSFDDRVLRWMNRRHDAAGALRAVDIIREGGIENLSIDLISGIRGLSEDIWKRTLQQAVALRPEHISAYQLSVEQGSTLEGWRQEGKYKEADEEQCRAEYGLLCKMLSHSGYEHYEVSNFALLGREARHNASYWARVPYVGLGAGAHSFDGARRSWNSETVPCYTRTYETLSAEDIRVETLMLALRTSRGIDEEYLRGQCDNALIDRLLEKKALSVTGRNIRIPESRFFVSDEIIRELI